MYLNTYHVSEANRGTEHFEQALHVLTTYKLHQQTTYSHLGSTHLVSQCV